MDISASDFYLPPYAEKYRPSSSVKSQKTLNLIHPLALLQQTRSPALSIRHRLPVAFKGEGRAAGSYTAMQKAAMAARAGALPLCAQPRLYQRLRQRVTVRKLLSSSAPWVLSARGSGHSAAAKSSALPLGQAPRRPLLPCQVPCVHMEAATPCQTLHINPLHHLNQAPVRCQAAAPAYTVSAPTATTAQQQPTAVSPPAILVRGRLRMRLIGDRLRLLVEKCGSVAATNP
jgi:hypothetical protein